MKKVSNGRRISLVLAAILPDFFASRLRNPIFFIGCGRSGTTLLTKLFGLHLDVANWSEANEIWDLQWPNRTPPIWADPAAHSASWWHDTQPRQRELRAIFGAYQWLSHKPCFLNKSPLNTFRIPQLLTMFPKARFVHIVRDGRAVVYSYTCRHLDKKQAETYRVMGSTGSFEELAVRLASFWKANLKEVAQQDKALGLSEVGILLELTYEELCADTSAALDSICQHVGLDPSRFAPAVRQERVQNRNYKWQEGLDADLITRMVATMEPVLTQKGYV